MIRGMDNGNQYLVRDYQQPEELASVFEKFFSKHEELWYIIVSKQKNPQCKKGGFRGHTVWIFEIGGTWIFIKDQWQFIYLFIVLILSVSFYYEVPSESACNPHIMKVATISFYAVSASPCQCLIRPVQRLKVSLFFSFFSLVCKLHQRACI